VRLSNVMAGIIIIAIICAGCTNKEPQQGEYTCIVVNKERKGSTYILEVTNAERHEYAEISARHWDDVAIGDSVTFNQTGVLTKINNKPVEP